MTVIEGADFSSAVNSNWDALATSLLASGKKFVWRYAVNDKSPSGRGITAAEYKAYVSAGLEVGLYWESTEGWMTGGKAAGISAAQNAQANLVAAGMPPTIPVYFAADFDATPAQQAQIDDCLKGAASVLGANRVGIYGGFYVVQRCSQNKSAAWFCQTSAWSGGQWFSGNHLEQYGYNHIIGGVNCDDVRAKQANYGQASKFTGGSGVTYPEGLDAGIAKRFFGSVKASNGVVVSYTEGEELSNLWLQSGSYGRIVDVGVYDDAPGIQRLTWQFSDGQAYHRPNANEQIQRIGGK